MSKIIIILCLVGCAQVTPDAMTDKKIEVMKSMRNPICREVGSYLYCNER
jgi:hypothetical protein